MFVFTILFETGNAVDYQCNSESEARAYAKRIANGREILCIV